MSRKIVYMRPDGGMSVVHPVRNTHPALETLTDAQIERRAWSRLPPDAINPRWAFESDIPTDRTFRDAWSDTGSGLVQVDMSKAQEIQKDRLRELRAPKLEALDIAFMKALESGDTKAQADVVAQKQALRDVTNDPALAAATTPEQLKQAGLDVIAAIEVAAVAVKG